MFINILISPCIFVSAHCVLWEGKAKTVGKNWDTYVTQTTNMTPQNEAQEIYVTKLGMQDSQRVRTLDQTNKNKFSNVPLQFCFSLLCIEGVLCGGKPN